MNNLLIIHSLQKLKTMEKTEKTINDAMKSLSELGCLKHLTVNDIDIIRYRLKLIAGSAVMEAQAEITNLLPKLYNQITNI